MKISLVGRGQIGTALFETLAFDHEVTWHVGQMQDLDATHFRGKDYVINAAGKTDLRWCEDNVRDAFTENVEATIGLYREVRKAESFLIHLSSGCVWDGPYSDDGRGFRPYDPPKPTSYYAWTKAVADAMMLREDPDEVAILRPRQVFSGSASPRNTLQKLRRYERLIDTPNSMTSIDAIISVVEHLLANTQPAVWNVYNPGITTPFRVGKMLAEAGLRDEPSSMTKAELDAIHRPKRVDTVLYDPKMEALQQLPLDVALKSAISKLPR